MSLFRKRLNVCPIANKLGISGLSINVFLYHSFFWIQNIFVIWLLNFLMYDIILKEICLWFHNLWKIIRLNWNKVDFLCPKVDSFYNFFKVNINQARQYIYYYDFIIKKYFSIFLKNFIHKTVKEAIYFENWLSLDKCLKTDHFSVKNTKAGDFSLQNHRKARRFLEKIAKTNILNNFNKLFRRNHK